MIKYNDSTITAGQIKQVLKNFNLPKVSVWKSGMLVFEGCCYITQQYVVQALHTGMFEEIDDTNFKVLYPFVVNQKRLNFTKNYELNSLLYDSYTHKYLGDYLRFIRDFYDVDVMSMYNCFSNEQVSNVSFGLQYSQTLEEVTILEDEDDPTSDLEPVYETSVSDSNQVFVTFDIYSKLSIQSSNDEKFKIFAVPIKLFKKYTIGIDCDAEVEFVADFYSENRRLDVETAEVMNKFYRRTYKRFHAMRFNKPILYTGVAYEDISDLSETDLGILKRFYLQEQNLKLYIKVPTSCASSITILEGDYVSGSNFYFNKYAHKVISGLPLRFIDEKTKKSLTKHDYISRHQLLNINSGISYPIADKLVDFLCNNIISPIDTISENISRVQKKLETPVKRFDPVKQELVTVVRKQYTQYPGIWEDSDREAIYDDACRTKIISSKFDITGYVDNDIEGSTVIGEYDYGN